MAINLTIPQSWNELNQKQFEKIALLFSTAEPSLIRDVKLLKILLKIKWHQFIKKAKVRVFLKNIPYSEWSKYLKIFFSKIDRTEFVAKVKVGKKIYYGPMARIQNLDAEEFAVADDLHFMYRQTKDKEYLQYLFHVLYSETEERNVFDKNKLEKSINNKVPDSVLLITEFTYLGCKNYIASKFPKAFPKTKNTSGQRNGFGKVIQAMAKGDLSKLPTIERTNIYKFLNQFQDDIEEYNKQKSKK